MIPTIILIKWRCFLACHYNNNIHTLKLSSFEFTSWLQHPSQCSIFTNSYRFILEPMNGLSLFYCTLHYFPTVITVWRPDCFLQSFLRRFSDIITLYNFYSTTQEVSWKYNLGYIDLPSTVSAVKNYPTTTLSSSQSRAWIQSNILFVVLYRTE